MEVTVRTERLSPVQVPLAVAALKWLLVTALLIGPLRVQAQPGQENTGGSVDTTGGSVSPRPHAPLPGSSSVDPAMPATQAPAAAKRQDRSSADLSAPDGAPTGDDAKVIAAALGFIAPRSLDPTTIPQLTLWGLQALVTLDPSLALRSANGMVRLELIAAHQSSAGISPGTAQPAPTPPDHEAVQLDAPGSARPGTDGQEDASPHDAEFVRAFAPETDASGWGTLTAAALNWAAGHSAAIRNAGGPALLQDFFDEVFSHLDPYSRYVPPTDAQHVRDRLAGQVGIGVELSRLGSTLVLATVAANGPAAEAGLRAGERLLAVDGVPTAGADVASVAAQLVGEEDTSVRLLVAGPRGGSRTLVLHRAVVPPETVFAEHVPLGARDGGTRGADLLMLRITAFTADTAERLSQELESGLSQRTRGLILDLRGDRGGLLRQAVTAVALVLKKGVVATTVGRAPEASRVWQVQGGDLTQGLPIVVLVDGHTASASEIMAAALADQGRAVVVGSTTLGKGVVQTLTELPNGGEIFVTWSRVLAPLGWPLQGLGVLPQLCTSLGLDATARQLRRLAAGTQDMAETLENWRAARAPLDSQLLLQMRDACPAAEGRDGDLEVARILLGHPRAYTTALLPASAAATASDASR